MKSLCTVLLGLLLAPASALAAPYPEYQITFSPGGGSDVRARRIPDS